MKVILCSWWRAITKHSNILCLYHSNTQSANVPCLPEAVQPPWQANKWFYWLVTRQVWQMWRYCSHTDNSHILAVIELLMSDWWGYAYCEWGTMLHVARPYTLTFVLPKPFLAMPKGNKQAEAANKRSAELKEMAIQCAVKLCKSLACLNPNKPPGYWALCRMVKGKLERETGVKIELCHNTVHSKSLSMSVICKG